MHGDGVRGQGWVGEGAKERGRQGPVRGTAVDVRGTGYGAGSPHTTPDGLQHCYDLSVWGGCLAKGSGVKLAAAERMQEGYRKELSPPTGVKRRRKRADGGKRAERRRTWARRATELGDRLPYKAGCSIATAYNSGRWAGEGVRGHARGCRTDAGKLQEGALSTNRGEEAKERSRRGASERNDRRRELDGLRN